MPPRHYAAAAAAGVGIGAGNQQALCRSSRPPSAAGWNDRNDAASYFCGLRRPGDDAIDLVCTMPGGILMAKPVIGRNFGDSAGDSDRPGASLMKASLEAQGTLRRAPHEMAALPTGVSSHRRCRLGFMRRSPGHAPA